MATFAKQFWTTEVLLYPCLCYCKGGNCSSQVIEVIVCVICCTYEMLTGDMSAGVQVNTPVLLSNDAPLGRDVLNWRSTLSPSGSDVVTVNLPVTPTVTLKVFTTWMRGLPLATNKTNNVNISFKQLHNKENGNFGKVHMMI